MAATKTTKTKTKKKTTTTTKKAKTTNAKTSGAVVETSAKTARVRKNDKPCKVQGCKREYRAKGYCKAHYRMWRHGDFGKKRYTACSDYGCYRPQGLNRHGFCEQHFQDFYIKGMERTHAPVAETKEKPAAADEKAA